MGRAQGWGARMLRRTVVVVGLAVSAATLASATPAAAQSPTTGVIGGCYYCTNFQQTDPAVLRSVNTRADLGTISLDVNRGHRGNVRVQAWLYSYATGRYVQSHDRWYLDEYSSSYVSAPGTGLVSFAPPSRGQYAVYVRLSYADGYVSANGWAISYWNYAYNSFTRQWGWTSSHSAWL